MVAMDAEQLYAFLESVFPIAIESGFTIDEVDPDGVTIGLETDARHLRPGGTVSGPTLMTLADTATYLAVLSRVGPQALAVTTSMEMHFLRKPMPGLLRTRARLLKVGRTLAVAVAEVHTGGELVAYGTVTYAIPR